MLECLECAKLYNTKLNSCEYCGFEPVKINNFYSYAPKLAYEGIESPQSAELSHSSKSSAWSESSEHQGFKPEAFERLAKLEGNHFWFRARNKNILWAIQKYFPNFESFMEIGCGTGFVLSAIATKYPSAVCIGSELFVDGLKHAAKRIPSATCVQMDARKIPYKEEFDLIGAFDVLEHIKEDETVLQNIYQALRPQGGLLLTVPQHQWLWSQADDIACHVRRYSSADLNLKLKKAGFEILRSTSFVSFLLPAMLLSRSRGQNGKTYDPMDEFKMNHFLNRSLESVLNVERLLIQSGINFPIGGSRFIIARKCAV